MKRISGTILIILIAVWMINGCIDAPSFESIPELSNARLELGSSPIVPNDSNSFVTILVDFSDGDGDIGHRPSDSINDLYLENRQLYVYDDSLNMADTTLIDTLISTYLIPFLPGNGGVPDITGTIRVQLLDPVKAPSTFNGFCLVNNLNPSVIVDPPLTEIRYRIWIKDRAGHLSNVLDVPPIPIDCD